MHHGLRFVEEDENTISRGSITVLFSYQVSILSLLEYESTQRERTLSVGPFTLKMIMQINCPILAHICCVEKFKWPLTKDTVVLRVTTRTFVIALPGLLYALQLPGHCSRERLRILSSVFNKYGHYKDLRQRKLGGYRMQYNEPGMLKRLRPHFEPLAHEALMEIGNIPGISRFCMEDQNSSFLRACRMSVTTKMIMESMRVKTMTDSLVNIRGMSPPDLPHQGRAYALASTFTRLVDAAEYSTLIFSALGDQVQDIESPLRYASVDAAFQNWNLSEMGLLCFISRLGPDVEKEEKEVIANEELWNSVAGDQEEEEDEDDDNDNNEDNNNDDGNNDKEEEDEDENEDEIHR
ncbi:uncharacterized protein LOC109802859 [Cajanus cajan]|uniref:uncharacterized protein LOC109802859 n=1 Tax=Cajanus cajan TaxID=3821 RepID=UPI00098D8564|nr:uncharacterized protein LOC109802859 [Cajanus cajan]XP_020219864.1 uncharacterized protein LOC109802859 [Cajanus cajan]